ncbi:putative 2-hydroxyacid dehydrogenase [subsurface metagenome]
MKPKVFVTRDIRKIAGGEVLNSAEAECELEIFSSDRKMRRSELLEKVGDKEGLLCLIGDSVDKEVIEAGKNLKIIANYGVGTDHIDVETATSRGILVTNTPSEDIGVAVAETAWALLMAVTQQVLIGDKDVRAGRYEGWDPAKWIGADIFGKTLGIVGLGRIGQEVARRGQGWNLRFLYYDVITIDPNIEQELGVERVSLETLLKESDFITLHCPLIPGKTYHLLGEKELSLMKPTAYLVNTSRGPVIDEKVLVRFLQEKRIAGAALDVYENEPRLSEGLADLDNVILTPHLASASARSRTAYAVLSVKNLLAGLRGELPPNLVNTELIKGRA